MLVPALAIVLSACNSMLLSATWLHISFCRPARVGQFSFADNAWECYSVENESNFSWIAVLGQASAFLPLRTRNASVGAKVSVTESCRILLSSLKLLNWKISPLVVG